MSHPANGYEHAAEVVCPEVKWTSVWIVTENYNGNGIDVFMHVFASEIEAKECIIRSPFLQKYGLISEHRMKIS